MMPAVCAKLKKLEHAMVMMRGMPVFGLSKFNSVFEMNVRKAITI